jgi:hypothetical protein
MFIDSNSEEAIGWTVASNILYLMVLAVQLGLRTSFAGLWINAALAAGGFLLVQIALIAVNWRYYREQQLKHYFALHGWLLVMT